MRTATQVCICLAAAFSGVLATASEQSELQRKNERLEIMATSPDRIAHVAQASRAGTAQDEHIEDSPYLVDIGVYGITLPSINPDEQWVRIACFSEPGRRYDGLSLMYVDLVARHRDGTWRSTDEGNDRGICWVDNGVDTTFIAVPRDLKIQSWSIYVTTAEQRSRNVRIGKRILTQPYIYSDDADG